MNIQDLQKKANQRAAMAAILISIIKSDENTPIENIKTAIAGCFAEMIDMDLMIGDEIDLLVAHTMKDYLEAQKAVGDVQDLLNQS